MFITSHVLTGVFISQKVSSPWWVFLISLISHFILDFIPHGDELIAQWREQKNPKRRTLFVVTIDLFTSIAFILIILANTGEPQSLLLLAGIVGSILPDMISHVLCPTGSYFLRGHHSIKEFIRKYNPLKPLIIPHNNLHNLLHNPFKKIMPVKIGIIFQMTFNLFLLINIILAA